MNIQSFHLSAFVRALAERPNTEVWFGYEEDLPAERKSLGWNLPDFGKAKLFDSRDPAQFEAQVARDGADTCHAFGSYFQLPKAGAAFQRLKSKPCRRVWISEAFNYFGWKGWLRTQRVRWLALKEARKSFDRVFAMGELGTYFFRESWLRSQQLREFAYTVELPKMDFHQPTTNNHQLRLLYVGQLIRRKGVDLLLRALSDLDRQSWKLSIIGDGLEATALRTFAEVNDLNENIQFLGVIPNSDIAAQMKQADVLVLPSRWDGWGAVVNEALHCGTGVIVSNACGAASLVRSVQQGWVFESENISSLRRQLIAAIEENSNGKTLLSTWATNRISGTQVADYFVQCLHSDLVVDAPWKAS
jgi:glycosyltransferase involved in cell wall biosynthesis